MSQSGFEQVAEPPAGQKEEFIKKLTDMGANRDLAIALLKKCGWNVEVAGAAYFEQKDKK